MVGCSLQKQQPVTTSEPAKPKSINSTAQVSQTQTYPTIKQKLLPTEFTDCGLNPSARELAKLIVNDNEQQRYIINCDKRLAQIAQDKAKDMALNGSVSHKDSYGGPNRRLLAFKYPLAASEHEQFNSVEAIMGGDEYANEVWLTFKTSYGHKIHLLAEHPFYENQTQLGVGYYRNLQSPHLDYWAVYFVNIEN